MQKLETNRDARCFPQVFSDLPTGGPGTANRLNSAANPPGLMAVICAFNRGSSSTRDERHGSHEEDGLPAGERNGMIHAMAKGK